MNIYTYAGRVWRIGRVDAFRPKGYRFDSRSNRHVGPWASPSLAAAVALRREIPAQYPCCVGSASE